MFSLFLIILYNHIIILIYIIFYINIVLINLLNLLYVDLTTNYFYENKNILYNRNIIIRIKILLHNLCILIF